MTTFEVDAEGFFNWLDKTSNRFLRMAKTMKNVAEIINLETIPLVPLEHHGLEQSFFYEVHKNSSFILLGLGFDEVDQKSGFHYAQYQHDVILTEQHPIRGEQFYLYKGIANAEKEVFQMIEQDYFSLFEGGDVQAGKTNIDDLLHPREVFFDLDNLRGGFW